MALRKTMSLSELRDRNEQSKAAATARRQQANEPKPKAG